MRGWLMLAVGLALAASSCWGVADFIGGLQSRTLSVPVVICVVEGTGLALVLVAIAVSGDPFPGTRDAVLGVFAGLASLVGLACFLRALSIGTMSIVAPISATGVALPVVVGLVSGDRLSTVVAAGIAVAVIGVVLASREQHEDAARAAIGRSSILFALGAAIGFGSYFTLADAAAGGGVWWLLALSRIVPVPAAALLAWNRGMRAPPRPRLLVLIGAGTIDCSATGFYALATTKGALSIVAVVGSLYPVMTVVLARTFLGERIRPVQQAGVIAALAGVALIAAG
jgi:drug/metabolite transporter (DMT)-like permease